LRNEMNTTRSISARMLNVLATPGEVFDQVIAAPLDMANWRAPMLLTCLAGLMAFYGRPDRSWGAGEPLAGSLVVLGATIGGSVWTAVVLWLIGRFCLKVRFSFRKTFEIVGLAGVVMALGQIASALLGAGFGSQARPSLAILTPNLPLGHGLRQALETFNLFYVWTVAVLCIGLSKLAQVPMKEAGFWVVGYWIVLRLVLKIVV
jgi:hypothetical protein